MTKLSKLLRAGTAVLALSAAYAAAPVAAHAAQKVKLIESGSSLLYPLFNLWVSGYSANHPNVNITTTSTGSGAGIAQSIKGLVQIGASDAYLSDAMVKAHSSMLSIPLAISSQAINYNLSGIKHLNLSGPILADIYTGKITMWNDPAIVAANPGVTLPDHKIIPIHRADGSGDTFLFSQYLDFSDPTWAANEHYGTTISWPAVNGELGEKGNQGMVTAAAATPYSVAYIGISFADQAAKAGLGQAALLDKHGEYVLPTKQNVSNAASSVASSTPADERISIVYTPGVNAYPIVNYEYAILNADQPKKSTAKAIKNFLMWGLNEGSAPKYVDQVHFLALPKSIKKLSVAQIKEIH